MDKPPLPRGGGVASPRPRPQMVSLASDVQELREAGLKGVTSEETRLLIGSLDWVRGPVPPSSPRRVLSHVRWAPALGALGVLVGRQWPAGAVLRPQFGSLPWAARLAHMVPVFLALRMRLYVGWLCAEAACVAAGLGGYPKNSNPKAGQGPVPGVQLSPRTTGISRPSRQLTPGALSQVCSSPPGRLGFHDHPDGGPLGHGGGPQVPGRAAPLSMGFVLRGAAETLHFWASVHFCLHVVPLGILLLAVGFGGKNPKKGSGEREGGSAGIQQGGESVNPEIREGEEARNPKIQQGWESLSPEIREGREFGNAGIREGGEFGNPKIQQGGELGNAESREEWESLNPKIRESGESLNPKSREGGEFGNPEIREEWESLNPKIQEECESLNPKIREGGELVNPKIQQEWESLNPKIWEGRESLNPKIQQGGEFVNPKIQQRGESINPKIREGGESVNPKFWEGGESVHPKFREGWESLNPKIQEWGEPPDPKMQEKENSQNPKSQELRKRRDPDSQAGEKS